LRSVLLQILAKGELQVSEKERDMMIDKTFRDVATIVSEKCVDPQTNRPLTVGLIERAMRDLHVSVLATKPAKQQALEVIKQLQQSGKIPIARAKMRLKLTMATSDYDKVRTELKDAIAAIEKEANVEQQTVLVCER
jgi:ribosome maturation protein SDO1